MNIYVNILIKGLLLVSILVRYKDKPCLSVVGIRKKFGDLFDWLMRAKTLSRKGDLYLHSVRSKAHSMDFYFYMISAINEANDILIN